MIQVQLGPDHTTKLHRLMNYLLQELRGRGSLSEGDTSENERKHFSFKQTYRRTNTRGATLPVQMLRADETRDWVVREHEAQSVAAWTGLSALACCLGVDAATTTPTTSCPSCRILSGARLRSPSDCLCVARRSSTALRDSLTSSIVTRRTPGAGTRSVWSFVG